jgi:hypothetical protein
VFCLKNSISSSHLERGTVNIAVLTPQKFGATLLPMKLLVKQKAKTVDNGKEKLKFGLFVMAK